jgi:hypothetical protein
MGDKSRPQDVSQIMMASLILDFQQEMKLQDTHKTKNGSHKSNSPPRIEEND